MVTLNSYLVVEYNTGECETRAQEYFSDSVIPYCICVSVYLYYLFEAPML